MSGVSGAFLLLPFQMSVLGYTAPSVSATNHLFNVVAIPGGLYRYIKEGRMVWPLALVVVAGTLPGAVAGALIRVKFLPDPQSFKLFAGAVLLYIGVRMVKDLTTNRSKEKKGTKAELQQLAEEAFIKQRQEASRLDGNQPRGTNTLNIKKFSLTELRYEFCNTTFTVNIPAILLMSAAVGLAGGVYGIGGGAIIAPFFVSMFRLPVYTVAGAALLGTFVTSLAGVLFYQYLAMFYPDLSVSPDWLLGLLFGIGGMAGTYLGAKAQKHIPARPIKAILATSVMFIAVTYIAKALH